MISIPNTSRRREDDINASATPTEPKLIDNSERANAKCAGPSGEFSADGKPVLSATEEA